MASALPIKNKLHLSWSDSTFFSWLNETTVLDYFCDPRNPFYNTDCNNQHLKMQGSRIEQLTTMTGNEYQLFLSQPPLYVIRKVQRKSPKEVIPMSYYYILHGVVYQAPDLMSILSSRLEMTAHYLGECLDSAFVHYKFNPSKGYTWDFNQIEESKKKDEVVQQPRFSLFQRERVDPLLKEFYNRFPPVMRQEQEDLAAKNNNEPTTQEQLANAADAKSNDQPVEKKMKMNNR